MQSTNFLRVSISNLPSTMNEEKLSRIFSEIDFVKISLAKCLKGICKGYGYMDLSCEKDVKKVLEMNGYVVDGKKIKIEEDREELNELKKQSSTRENNLSQILPVEEKMNEEDPLKVRKQLFEVSHKFNQQIISEQNKDTEENEICICLSCVNPQLVNEMKHLFPNLSEHDFKHQINKNDELKKIYLNCCSESHSLEEKIQKIQHLKFDDNPIRDEQLKTLCCVVVKSFENNKDIDFNICNRLSSNLKSINCFPERAIVFEIDFSTEILGEHSFKEFIMDKRKQKIIEMNLQKKIGEILEIPFGDVVFLKIREGIVKFSGIIPPKALLKQKGEQTELNDYVYNVLKKKLREGLGQVYPLKGLEMGFQTFKSKLSLNPCDFDTAGDYYFRSKSGDKQTRGGYPYYQPSKKWKRYGLRVMGIYENDDWLKMDNSPNEWAVAFHGTMTNEIKVTEKGASIQVTQVISSDDIDENLQKFGHLFVQDVEDCITNPVEWQGDIYEIAFQCRIHPDHIKVTGTRTFITVDNPHFVRPYGILMKKHDLKKIK